MSAESTQERSPLLKRALFALRDMQSRVNALERSQREPIAIIGMGCRFPGNCRDADSYWHLLRDGIDSIGPIPESRWDVDAFYDADPNAPGKMYTRHGGFLSEIDAFDANFFGISPREAVGIDPQQRLLLEVVWEAFENACLPIDSLAGGRTGVFAGVTANEYLQLAVGNLKTLDAYSMTGGVLNFAAGRLAYALDLEGPCMAVDAACASSLVTVHLACRSLRSHECSVAVAGGVNLILTPSTNILVSKTRALSPDGRCKAFDASADGIGRGEGCGAVILKRLSDALRDGNRVLAVIRGSAVSQYGHSRGFTVPNPRAQEALLREALSDGGVDPGEVSYIEAHATGTPLGDPIEMQALGEVYGPNRPIGRKLTVGSVKGNIGHLESAAGVAGLIKVVLALQHREIPAHLHFREPSPNIPWDTLPVTIPTALTAWDVGEGKRIAGVSGFGMNGTIAHVLVEEAPVAQPAGEQPPKTAQILTLSAKSPEALRALADRYAMHLRSTPDEGLADICYTANCGRTHFAHRAAIVVANVAEAIDLLTAFACGDDAGVADVSGVMDPADGGDARSPEDLALLYLSGARVDWSGVYRNEGRQFVTLPGYPFQRSRYWLERKVDREPSAENSGTSLLGQRLMSPAVKGTVFEARWSERDAAALLADEVTKAIPLAAYRELLHEAAGETWGAQRYSFEEIVLGEPMILREPRMVQFLFGGEDDALRAFEVVSKKSADYCREGIAWSSHVSGRIRVGAAATKGQLASWVKEARAYEVGDLVLEYVRRQTVDVLRMDRDARFDDRLPLHELGMNSVTATELANRLSESAGRTFSAGLLFLYPSVKALADYICSELRVASDTEMAIKAADAAGVPDLEELSADELNAILAEFAEAAP